jgi:hypothetical protein
VEQSRLHVLEPAFFANGAEVGGVRERALGSPTHPLAHGGAWRRKTGRGGSAPPLRRHDYGLRQTGRRYRQTQYDTQTQAQTQTAGCRWLELELGVGVGSCELGVGVAGLGLGVGVGGWRRAKESAAGAGRACLQFPVAGKRGSGRQQFSNLLSVIGYRLLLLIAYCALLHHARCAMRAHGSRGPTV